MKTSEIVKTIVTLYKTTRHYQNLFSDKNEGLTTNVKLRCQLPNELLEDIQKYNEIDSEAELFQLVTEQLCSEVVQISLRQLRESSGVEESTLVDLQETIKNMGDDQWLIVSPEVNAHLMDYIINQPHPTTPYWAYFKEMGTIQGKRVFMNPYLPYNTVQIVQERWASFEIGPYDTIGEPPFCGFCTKFKADITVKNKGHKAYTLPEIKNEWGAVNLFNY